MMKIRSLIGLAAVLALSLVPASLLFAQGMTTGGVTGTVTDEAGAGLEGVQVQVRNALTGFSAGAITRANGLYRVQGLEPNQGYSVTVRRIGFAPVTRTNITIALGEARREDFKLSQAAATLSGVTIVAQAADAMITPSKSGTTSTISDSLLRRLPTIDRNFTEFVSLVPQISTTTGYLSGGGVNLRQNSIQIDGATATDLFGLGTTGQQGASAGGKSIPLDAVKEYQVMLSPFDVRQGSFGGVLINAVTKSGTNEWHGTMYADGRSQNLTRTDPLNGAYKSRHGSISIGGPILKDRLFLFVSGEQQSLAYPASGSYIGAPDQYIAQSTIDQVNVAAKKWGLADVGGGEIVPKTNPNTNLFTRIDANLPFNTRLVLRNNYASSDNTSFSRAYGTASNPQFRLSSNMYATSNTNKSTVLELLTHFSGGVYNEFLGNISRNKDFRTVPVWGPQFTIQGLPRSDDPAQTLQVVFGTEYSSQGNAVDQRVTEFTDNLTIPLGKHSITVGGKYMSYHWINLYASNALGAWTFKTLDDFVAGKASGYVGGIPYPTDPYKGVADVTAATYTGYVEDKWQVTPRLVITAGVRMDKPDFKQLPPFNDEVSTDYNRATSSVPTKAMILPRGSFNWDVTGDQRNQLRGGIGAFSGPPPYVYLSNAFGGSGLSGFGTLTCTSTSVSPAATTSGLPPMFTAAAIKALPTACAPFTRTNGQVVPGNALTGPSAGSNINSIDPNFKMPTYLKATVGYDRRLKGDMVATLEALWTSSINAAYYQNLSLTTTPVAQDPHGRQMYGTLAATGATAGTHGPRALVLDLTNSHADYTWSVTAQLQKTFSRSFSGSFAYTHQESKDVAAITSSTATSNYRYQRDVSGRLDDMTATRSKYDQPHRIVLTGTWRAPWDMDVSFSYAGNSGAPYDYVYGSGASGMGDLNADGQSQNDLIYVPRNATDPTEILFQGYNSTNATTKAAADNQAAVFEKFISSVPCLQQARGTIMKRNACRNPWNSLIKLSVGQNLGKLFGVANNLHASALNNVQVRWDVENVANLLNKNWGWQEYSSQNNTCGQICSATVAISHVGFSLPAGTTSSPNAIPVVTFNPTYSAWDHNNIGSLYRMQFSVRYSF